MSLIKINNFIIYLRLIIIGYSLISICFKKLLFINFFPNFFNLVALKLLDFFIEIQIIFILMIILLVPTHYALKFFVLMIHWQHVHRITVVSMKGSIALITLSRCSRLNASIACKWFILYQIKQSCPYIHPSHLLIVIKHILI
jgi:hypothetical protein